MELEVLGEKVRVAETLLECERGGDHRKLVLDARVDCLTRGFMPDERFALCGRCRKAVSLKV